MTPTANRRSLLALGAVAPFAVAGADHAHHQAATIGYAAVNGLDVYYEVHGGPLTAGAAPTVLLHGGMMAIESAFAGRWLSLLAARGPVIAIEQSGHGHTALRSDGLSVEQMIADTVGVLDHLGVQRAHFMGHSLGGMISTGVAIRHPDRVASIVPVSAGYNSDGQIPELIEMQRNPQHTPSPALAALLPSQDDFVAMMATFQTVAPDREGFPKTMAAMQALLQQWPGWTPAELGAIAAPTLIVAGDNDFSRVDHLAEMKALIPGARLAILPGTTHMSILDRGDWILPMLEVG